MSLIVPKVSQTDFFDQRRCRPVGQCVFSNESHFMLFHSDGRAHVHCSHGQKLKDVFIQTMESNCGPLVMVGHFWMWRSRAGQLRVQAWKPSSMFGTKWGSGCKTWVTPRCPLCQNFSLLSSKHRLPFAKERSEPWWKACHAACLPFSLAEGATQGISGVMTWLHACLTDS